MSGLTGKEIEFIYKEGKKINSKFFNFYFFPSSNFKVSPVVSKKISKKAVIRNKIKRRIRHLSRLYLKSGLYLIKPKEDISKIEFRLLENDFKKVSIKIDKIL